MGDICKAFGKFPGDESEWDDKRLDGKKSNFINRNNELVQEFRFAHPQTLIKVNSIYNTSFYGCVLWDLFSKEAERLEKTWNVT